LSRQQSGAYAEYFVKMEFTMFGFQVYETEVDDRGIDFIVRLESGPFIEIQVKSLRGLGYAFAQKDKFKIRESLYMSFVMLKEGEAPILYLIPSTAWLDPNELFVSRNYEGKKSKPEWGLNISQRNMPLLEKFTFENFAVRARNQCV
jgi:hypothetical protein